MRMARLELARSDHTHLKRARIPIPPHPLITQEIRTYLYQKQILLKILIGRLVRVPSLL